ncbi:MAG: polymer-forming cytoskeletal protein [Campylobacteraceae bacterium]|jgi:cytoskeletal protein CcmA (bactofilin family)|nr:polymer-forming cytoskeletal protein [Campylobacteraceae bacterium]
MGLFVRGDEHIISKQTESTIVANGAKLEGIFELSTYLYVDGVVLGKVYSTSTIVIGKRGLIKGDVEAPKMIINGKFEGKAMCESIEILEGGTLFGVVYSNELVIEQKSHFEGESHKKDIIDKPLITVEETSEEDKK